MTIKRETDFFGLVFSKSTPLSGTSERLRSEARLGGQLLEVSVRQPNVLEYITGTFEVVDGDIVSTGTTLKGRLDAARINDFDTASKRNWFGKRVRYRWYNDNPRITPLREPEEQAG